MDKLKSADHMIEVVERASSQLPGQELMEFVREVWESVVRSAEIIGARPGNVTVRAIFRDQVIVHDEANNQSVRLDMKRSSKGDIQFKNPVLVRRQWVEHGALEIQRDEDGDIVYRDVSEGDSSEVFAVHKSPSDVWTGTGVLGFAI